MSRSGFRRPACAHRNEPEVSSVERCCFTKIDGDAL
jgi:hypothetical protein